ncbi:prepilin-type N-terminal cleavage/methylation domain-containing protein [Parelusimicrobium proximum]|uniref:type IV pilin protein n=1 Tax=Parelusimicrobium proximum TaxID=3228953 RepID=UPI003D168E3B
MEKGFTLIELLVVVLIIAILAAVALPQYTAAVEKSKATQAFVMAKALGESAERYYLANDEWPTRFDQLDVTVPNKITGSCQQTTLADCVKTDKFDAELWNSGSGSFSIGARLRASALPWLYIGYYVNSAYFPGVERNLGCDIGAGPKAQLYDRICLSLGGVAMESGDVRPKHYKL